MPSLNMLVAAAIGLFSIVASAQEQYYIVPTSVNITTRTLWCQYEIATCPLLCLQLPGASSTTSRNTCNAELLTYQCVCGNGQSPNATEYSQTLPFFICQEWGVQCVKGCPTTDTACQAACTQNHPCGAQNPTRVSITTTETTLAPTAAGTGASATGTGAETSATVTVFNGFGGAAATTPAAGATNTPAAKNGAPSLHVATGYLSGILLTAVAAGFGLML